MKDRLAEIHGLTSKELDEERRKKHRKYMKQWRRRKAERERKELELAFDFKNFPISRNRPEECILFRRLVLGLESQDEYPFLKHNHLNFSLRGLKCKTCPRNCYCAEWHRSQKATFQGARIWQ